MILKATKIEMAGGRTDGVYVAEYELQEGMTLRDHFAAKAMQGMLVNGQYEWDGLARDAYSVADAMLAERNKE